MALDFTSLYLALQQSCQYYSNLALRQKQLGYQIPLGVNFPVAPARIRTEEPSTSNVVSGAAGSRRRGSKKMNNNSKVDSVPDPNKALLQNHNQNHLIPPVVISTEENYAVDTISCGVVHTPLNKTPRKVYFAHPLSTVKIKSPTPYHYEVEVEGGRQTGGFQDFQLEAEDDSDSGEVKVAPGQIQAVQGSSNGNVAYFMISDTSSGEDGSYPHGAAQYKATLAVPAPATPAKKKRRGKKRKKNRKTSWEETSYTDWLPFDEKDPYAIYEVPVNEDEYEFISDVRVCPGPGISSMEETMEEGAGGDAVTKKLLPVSMEQQRKEEMEELYGVTGSERIMWMEDQIEANFQKELRRVGKYDKI